MNRSTGKPTKAEEARFRKLKELGCIACYLSGNGHDGVEPHIHHYLSGGRRIGHMATIPLCAWCHTGVPFDGVPSSWFLATLGPSFHRHTRQFRERYGSDTELLATVNAMIGEGA